MEEFLDDSELASCCVNDEGLIESLKKRKENTLTVYDINSWRKRRSDESKMPGMNVLLNGVHSNLYTNQKFPSCKRLFAKKCEKNFFYHQVSKRNFPNVEELWIGSHPCDGKVFYEGFPKIFITPEYSHYAKRWAPKNCTYVSITQQEFDSAVSSFDKQELQ
ncbi:hypothetical protein A9K97_gp398 [Tokyovirus A1]|uniref:hypothetical protein n=1 Tax=Tokyovirus A1 TaxID=1826170 RepID=UPI0007A97C81|nr:hypothetical protein A9K97_gp398 [Tokyovirus A1]BAU79953.1 hypothetical protein [Tokyovirus A1]